MHDYKVFYNDVVQSKSLPLLAKALEQKKKEKKKNYEKFINCRILMICPWLL